jgi:hypothetical protein
MIPFQRVGDLAIVGRRIARQQMRLSDMERRQILADIDADNNVALIGR